MANVLSHKLIELIYLVLKTNREEGGYGPERVHKLVHRVNILSRAGFTYGAERVSSGLYLHG